MKFIVPDMTCGHCAGHINRAIKDADGQAVVDVDIAGKSISVSGTSASSDEIAQAIADAGYTPELQAA